MVHSLLGRRTFSHSNPLHLNDRHRPPPSPQAQLTWSWSQWLCSRAVADGKIPLLLNLDETAVPLEFTFGRGNIIYKERRKKIKNLPKQRANKSAIRCFFTHVAIICNVPEVQLRLPQVLFFSKRHLSWKVYREVEAMLPSNVLVFRQSSGWSNTAEHKKILQRIHDALAPFLHLYQPILSFDACPLHLEPGVLELLGELNLWWLLIPKKLTGLMQPYDTHRFAIYKRFCEIGG